MKPEKSTADLHDTAAAWVARLDRGTLSPDEQRRLDVWLAEHPRNMGAYVRAQAAWHLTGRSEIAGAALDRPRTTDRRRVLAWGAGTIAASLAAIALGVRSLVPRHFSTELGEVAQRSLSDGSVVALDTASAITEKFDPSERAVHLERGQAFFDVAKNPDRPFVVAASPIRVKAVGTAFIVRRYEGGAEVVVTEGVVAAWNSAAPDHTLTLAAGHCARLQDQTAAPAQPEAMSVEQINRKGAWRTGQIILSGETLAYAASEFNRYNREKIEIADAALARKTLVGGFRSSDPHGFAAVIAMVLHAKVQESGNTIILSR